MLGPSRSHVTAAAALLGLVLSVASACGTDAVGVEDCREIEQARCDIGLACGRIPDVEACKRFYRDHCLHGLPLESSPGTSQVRACTGAIAAAAQCAREQGPQATVQDCQAIGPAALQFACDVVDKPEETEACRFLVPAAPPVAIDAPADGPESDAGVD